MALADRLSGLTPAQRVSYLERVKRKLLDYHNQQMQTLLTKAERDAWERAEFFPRLNRLSAALSTARTSVAEATTYDASIDLTEI